MFHDKLDLGIIKYRYFFGIDETNTVYFGLNVQDISRETTKTLIFVIFNLIYNFKKMFQTDSIINKKKPEGTPEGEGVYLTVYPKLSPNTDSI